MSSPYSRARAAESMRQSSSATESSDTSSPTTIVSASSGSESATASSTTLQSSLMCERSPDCPTVEKWISSLEASRVSLSASPAESAEPTTIEISGRRPFAFFERSAQGSLSLKMCQGSLGLTDISGPSSETWPRAGILADGSVYPLPPAEPRTFETASGFLPTPAATTYGTGSGGIKAHLGHKPGLETMARKGLWPTPRSSPNENRQTKPTPSQLAGEHGKSLAAEVGGALNPEFCEYLMGWPIGATGLEPLATVKSRSVQQWHSAFYATASTD